MKALVCRFRPSLSISNVPWKTYQKTPCINLGTGTNAECSDEFVVSMFNLKLQIYSFNYKLTHKDIPDSFKCSKTFPRIKRAHKSYPCGKQNTITRW